MTAIIAELPRLIVRQTFSFRLNALPYPDFGAGRVAAVANGRCAQLIDRTRERGRPARMRAKGPHSEPEDRQSLAHLRTKQTGATIQPISPGRGENPR